FPPFLVYRSFAFPATTKIYSLSLHDALPIYSGADVAQPVQCDADGHAGLRSSIGCDGSSASCSSAAAGSAWSGRTYSVRPSSLIDRKSTRLNSSHVKISYAVFCLKKKNKLLY